MSAHPRRTFRTTLSTIGFVAVCGLGASACGLPGATGAAEAVGGNPAPTTASTLVQAVEPPNAPPTTAAPSEAIPSSVSSVRNAMLWPFSSDSPWNTPIGSGARLESTSGVLTSTIRRSNTTTWVNADKYSHPIYVATAADPVATVSTPWDGTYQVRIPAGAVPAAGTDAHLHVVQPDGRTIVEMWDAHRQSTTSFSAGRLEIVDLYGSGLGPDNGVRAYGGSAVGGLIRKWEVDPTDPNYTDGVIRHAIAIALPATMLKYTGGASGYDGAGFGTAKGYVWPATEQDWDSPSSYQGTIPMGQLFTIPTSVNVDALGLTPSARAIAKAIQDYGAYVTDRTGPNTVALYAEPTVPGSWLADVAGPNWTTAQLTTIRQNLVAVTNNGPATVGGGGSRPIAPAPGLG